MSKPADHTTRFRRETYTESLAAIELESTERYLGIEVDDALEMAEQTEV